MPIPIVKRQTTSTPSQRRSHGSPVRAASAMAIAHMTNGKASPSFRPASDVSANRVSSSCPDLGGPTCTSLANTGSVGASAAPRTNAVAAPSPSIMCPSHASARIVTGIAIANSRHVIIQECQPILRSIFRAAPIREIMITSSVSRSTTGKWLVGCGTETCKGSAKTIAPIATQEIGSDSGASLRTIGSHAVKRTKAPKPISRTMYGSGNSAPTNGSYPNS